MESKLLEARVRCQTWGWTPFCRISSMDLPLWMPSKAENLARMRGPDLLHVPQRSPSNIRDSPRRGMCSSLNWKVKSPVRRCCRNWTRRLAACSGERGTPLPVGIGGFFWAGRANTMQNQVSPIRRKLRERVSENVQGIDRLGRTSCCRQFEKRTLHSWP